MSNDTGWIIISPTRISLKCWFTQYHWRIMLNFQEGNPQCWVIGGGFLSYSLLYLQGEIASHDITAIWRWVVIEALTRQVQTKNNLQVVVGFEPEPFIGTMCQTYMNPGIPSRPLFTKSFRYLKWRVSWTWNKAILGVGFPLHKPYPYSLYRWVPPF